MTARSGARPMTAASRQAIVARRASAQVSGLPPLREAASTIARPMMASSGPMLLVGALVIVAVFGVVVWSAYRDGVKSDDTETAAPGWRQRGRSRPRRAKTLQRPAPSLSQVLEQLDGGPAPVGETRAEPAAAPRQLRPRRLLLQLLLSPTPVVAPSTQPKVAAVPPAPLKQPAAAPATTPAPAPVHQAITKPSAPIEVAVATAAPVAAKSGSPPVQLPKPSTTPAAAPAAMPAPAEAAGFKPAFSPSGAYARAGSQRRQRKRRRFLNGTSAPERCLSSFQAAERFIVQADVNGKTVYRLRAGSVRQQGRCGRLSAHAFKARAGTAFRRRSNRTT